MGLTPLSVPSMSDHTGGILFHPTFATRLVVYALSVFIKLFYGEI